MSKQVMSYGVIGLLVGSLITAFWLTKWTNTNYNGFMGMMGFRDNLSSSSLANLDKHFIEQMIPHHEGAIEMANLALERSSRPEINKLSNNIIESQSNEIALMRNWYKVWFDLNVPIDSDSGMGMGRGIMHGGMMGGEVDDIEELKNAVDFDKAFLEEMIPHHQMAVVMARMLSSGTNKPEMKQLAQDIVTAQELEIEEMRSWLKDWY